MKQFEIYIMREGEEHITPTGISFQTQQEAQTFAYIETLAGMGEEYFAIKNQ